VPEGLQGSFACFLPGTSSEAVSVRLLLWRTAERPRVQIPATPCAAFSSDPPLWRAVSLRILRVDGSIPFTPHGV
jgi:hypothetical protein